VLRAILDSSYTHALTDGITGAPELLLEDHFESVDAQ
jgi:hypothetical protein